MRLFVSYNTRDTARVAPVVDLLGKAWPDGEIYYAPARNLAGAYWIKDLGEELGVADAVILFIGAEIGAWQEIEYYEALRHTRRGGRPRIIPVLLDGTAPGLHFIGQFHRLDAASLQPQEVVLAISRALETAETQAVPLWRQINPYHGLFAMDTSRAAFFFGRERLTAEILRTLGRRSGGLRMLVGNSGVGKSSIVEAGVISALRSQVWPGEQDADWPQALDDSRGWLPVTVTPGNTPVGALARAMVGLWLEDPADREDQALKWVRNFHNGAALGSLVGAALEQLSQVSGGQPPQRLLLNVDQGEELFSRADRAETGLFSQLLAGAMECPDLTMIASMRSDYYGQLQEQSALFEITERIDVPPPTGAELHAMIERPAAALGARFAAPEILPMIVEATGRELGGLPLLSYMMAEAWDRMREDEAGDGVLRFPLGVVDISKPLTERAERFVALHPDQIEALRRVFTLRLAHVPTQGAPVRRVTLKSECSVEEWDAAVELSRPAWRLLASGEIDGMPFISVAHEALLRSWPRLRGWLEEERDFLVWKGQLETAHRDWQAAPPDHQEEALLTGYALSTARQWFASRKADLAEAERGFIERSISRDEARQERQRLQRETLLKTRASRNRLGSLLRAGFVVATVIFAVLGGIATWQWSEAVIARDEAEANLDIAESNFADAEQSRAMLLTALSREQETRVQLEGALRRTDEARLRAEQSAAKYFASLAGGLDAVAHGALKLLLGVEAIRLDHITEIDSQLRAILSSHPWEPLSGHVGPVETILFDETGEELLSAGRDGTLRLWDLADPDRPGSIIHAGDLPVRSVGYASGRIAALIGDDVLFWEDIASDAPPRRLAHGGGKLRTLALSPDGSALTLVPETGPAREISLRTDTIRKFDLPLGAERRAARYSLDGRWLAVAGGETVLIWDRTYPGAAPRRLTAQQGEIYSLDFSRNGDFLATGGFEPFFGNGVSLWDLRDPEGEARVVGEGFDPMGAGYTVTSIAVGMTQGAKDAGTLPDRLIVGTYEGLQGGGTLRIWRPEAPERHAVIARFAEVEAVAFAPQKWLAVADRNGAIHLHDMRQGGAEPRRQSSGAWVFAADASEGLAAIAIGTAEGDVLGLDGHQPGREAQQFGLEDSAVRSIALSPGGAFLAVGTEAGALSIRRRDAPGAAPVFAANVPGGVFRLSFAPEGRRVALAGSTGLSLIDFSGQDQPERVLYSGPERILALRFPASDRLIAATAGGALLVWETLAAEAEPRQIVLRAQGANTAALSPDGRWLALSSQMDRVEVYDLTLPSAPPQVLRVDVTRRVFSALGFPLAFSPDSAWLAFGAGDDRVWLWRSAQWSRPPLALTGHQAGVTSLSFAPDGRHLVSAGMDGTTRIWTQPDRLALRACARAARNMDLAEWQQYFGAQPYRKTCAEWPLPEGLYTDLAARVTRESEIPDALTTLRRAAGEGGETHRHRFARALVLAAEEAFTDESGAESATGLGKLALARNVLGETPLSELQVASADWNRICWRGALDGVAAQVLESCDLAIATAKETERPLWQDSRGLARALAGDVAGAVADFTAFVEWSEATGAQLIAAKRRRGWIAALEAGERPFDEKTLDILRETRR